MKLIARHKDGKISKWNVGDIPENYKKAINMVSEEITKTDKAQPIVVLCLVKS